MAVIEIVTFRLLDGAAEAEFLDADAAFQTGFVYRQPGLLRRTVARGDAGAWLAVGVWESQEAADAAWTAGQDEPLVARLAELVDMASGERRCFTTLD